MVQTTRDQLGVSPTACHEGTQRRLLSETNLDFEKLFEEWKLVQKSSQMVKVSEGLFRIMVVVGHKGDRFVGIVREKGASLF